jgi:hypothetical protein
MGPKLRGTVAPAFQDRIFLKHFGKSYFSLSDNENKRIKRTLEECFPDNWFIRYFITTPFEYSKRSKEGRTYQDWIHQINLMRRYEVSATDNREDTIVESQLKPETARSLEDVFGVWIGQRVVRNEPELLAISISKEGALLRVLSAEQSGTVTLRYKGEDDQTGEAVFDFSPFRGDTRRLSDPQIPTLMAGEIRLVPSKEVRYRRLDLRVPGPDSRSRTITPLTMDRNGRDRPVKIYRDDTGDELFEYSDWTAETRSAPSGYDLLRARQKLEAMVGELEASGWRCLTQVTMHVTEKSTAVLNSRGIAPHLHLIYSPSGYPNLVYHLGSSPSAYATVSSDQAYPTILSSPTNSKTRFWLRPNLDLQGGSNASVDITVYTFGRTWTEYGEGCEFTEIQPSRYAWTLGKILVAVWGESLRRDSAVGGDVVGQIAGIISRDLALKSALSDLFPEVKEQDMGYMTRLIATSASGGLSVGNLSQGTLREALVQRFEDEGAFEGYAARLADLLIDVQLRSRSNSTPKER